MLDKRFVEKATRIENTLKNIFTKSWIKLAIFMEFFLYSNSIFYCRKHVAQQWWNCKQAGKKILFLSLVVHKISEHKKTQNKQKNSLKKLPTLSEN